MNQIQFLQCNFESQKPEKILVFDKIYRPREINGNYISFYQYKMQLFSSNNDQNLGDETFQNSVKLIVIY